MNDETRNGGNLYEKEVFYKKYSMKFRGSCSEFDVMAE